MTPDPTMLAKRRDVVLAITGASGAIYSLRLLQVLLRAGIPVHLLISPSGQMVLRQELGLKVDLSRFRIEDLESPEIANSDSARLLENVLGNETGEFFPRDGGQLFYHHYQDWNAPVASGTFLCRGMAICPCSGTTLSAIAHSSSSNLIQRAAEVQLKERRRLILVPRETPVSTLQLENMQRVSAAGAVILPATPGWYHGVAGLRDLVDFIVARICDQLEVEHALIHRWGEE